MWRCFGRSSAYKDRDNDDPAQNRSNSQHNHDSPSSRPQYHLREDEQRLDDCTSSEGRKCRKERLHKKMQSELCEIRPELIATIGERRLALLRRQFSWHDSDNNGYIETNELPDFLRAAGFNPVQPSLEMWCSHLDSNNEGCLTFPDYVEFWHQNNAELEHDEALIAMAFKFFDKNDDGIVDKEEFIESLQRIGDPLTSDEIDTFFKHVHKESKKDTEELSITFDELLNFFREDRKNTRLLSDDFDDYDDYGGDGPPGSPDIEKLKQMAHKNVRTSKFVKQMYMKKMSAAIQRTKTAIRSTTKAVGKAMENTMGLRPSQTGRKAEIRRLDSHSKRSFSA